MDMVVSFLLQQGNPLHEAARQGDMDALKRLVNKGSDVNSKDDDGVNYRNLPKISPPLKIPHPLL